MSPFRFTGKDDKVTWYVQADPLNETIEARGSRDQPLTLDHISPRHPTQLRWEIESALRAYRLQAHGPDSVTLWQKCRERALEALKKYARNDLTWEIY